MCPEQFQESILCPLPKVAGTKEFGETRGISLLQCVGKLYTRILNARITCCLEESKKMMPEQGGFRKTRTTTEKTLTLYATVLRRKALNKPTYLCFIDLRKAYDRVLRHALWVKLHEVGIQGRC